MLGVNKTSVLYAYGAKALNAVIVFGVTLLLSNAMSASDFGAISFLVALFGFFSLLTLGGFDQVLIRDHGKVTFSIVRTKLLHRLTAMLLFSCLAMGLVYWNNYPEYFDRKTLLWICLCMIGFALNRIQKCKMQASGYVAIGLLLEQGVVNAFVLAYAVIFYRDGNITFTSIILAYLFGYWLSLVISIVLTPMIHGEAGNHKAKLADLSGIDVFLLFNLLQFVVIFGDILASGMLLKPDDAGEYAFYARIAMFIITAFIPLQAVLAPYFAAQFHRQISSVDQQKTGSLFVGVAFLTIGFLLGLGLWPLLVPVMPEEFGNIAAFSALCAANAAVAYSLYLTTRLVMSGGESRAAVALLAGLILQAVFLLMMPLSVLAVAASKVMLAIGVVSIVGVPDQWLVELGVRTKHRG